MDLTQPFQLTIFTITMITLLLQLFVLYIIIYVSPKAMYQYRVYLILTNVFEIVYSVNYGVCFLPEPPEFYPGGGNFVRGIASEFGEIGIKISGTGCYVLAAMMLGSQDICLLYRLFAIIPNKEYYKTFTSIKCTITMYSVILAISVAIGLGFLPAIAPPEDHKEILDAWTMNAIGKTIELDFKTPRLLLYNNRPYFKQFMNVVGVCLILSEVFYFLVVFLILFILKRDSDKFSRRSLKLHRQLTVLLAILVPLIMFVIPYTSLIVRMNQREITEKSIIVFGSIVFACHSFMMSMLIICLITPYRNFVIERLRHIAHPSKMFKKVTHPSKTGIFSTSV